MTDSGLDAGQQYGAIPVRRGAGAAEVLLVSSRETRRWVIPKGWPMIGYTPSQAAAREAFEEAGVEGKVSSASLGHYHYDKRLKSGDRRRCRVDVYVLEVEREYAAWPEAGERSRRWFRPEDAALAVDESELAALIRRVT